MLLGEHFNDYVKYFHPQYSICISLQMCPSAGVTTFPRDGDGKTNEIALVCNPIYPVFDIELSNPIPPQSFSGQVPRET